MKDTDDKPGRPLLFGARLERVQVMLRPDQREVAEAEAERRKMSVSTIYRDWIDAGMEKGKKVRR